MLFEYKEFDTGNSSLRDVFKLHGWLLFAAHCVTANKTHAQAHVEHQDQSSPITHKTPKITHNKQYTEKCTTLVTLPLYDQSRLKLTRPSAFLPRNALHSLFSMTYTPSSPRRRLPLTGSST